MFKNFVKYNVYNVNNLKTIVPNVFQVLIELIKPLSVNV